MTGVPHRDAPVPRPSVRLARLASTSARAAMGRFVALMLAFVALVPAGALGAELHLRESLLQAQRDRLTATVTAIVDHLGDEAHPPAEDCDLHVPLRSREIHVAFIGEVKNACSEKPPGTPRSYWSDQIYAATHGLAVPVTGVFRIWLEHPPTGDVVQTEAERVPWYPHSNPDHQVELHPLLRVGSLDFTGHVKGIAGFDGYGSDRLPTILRKRLTVQRISVGGESYVRIRGTKTGYNHWNLMGRVVQAAQALPDGAQVRLDILDDTGERVVPDALDIAATAVQGTVAHTKVQGLQFGAIIDFQALIRVHLPTILDRVAAAAQEIPLPIEFVILDLSEVQ